MKKTTIIALFLAGVVSVFAQTGGQLRDPKVATDINYRGYGVNALGYLQPKFVTVTTGTNGTLTIPSDVSFVTINAATTTNITAVAGVTDGRFYVFRATGGSPNFVETNTVYCSGAATNLTFTTNEYVVGIGNSTNGIVVK